MSNYIFRVYRDLAFHDIRKRFPCGEYPTDRSTLYCYLCASMGALKRVIGIFLQLIAQPHVCMGFFFLFESLSESDTSFKSRFARSRELEWTQLHLLCPASTCANPVSDFWPLFERMIQWAFVTATSQHNLSICQSMLLREFD